MEDVRSFGAPFGSAILGSVVVAVYQSNLNLAGLTSSVAATVKLSVFAGVAVAQKLHSTALLDSVRHAFVQGMDAALVVSAAIAAIGMLLAVAFLPGRTVVVAGSDAREVREVA